MEHLVFLGSVPILPCPLRKLREAFDLTASKSWNSQYFNTEKYLDYIGPILDVSYDGVNEMREEERQEVLASYYVSRKTEERFENRRVLEIYCQGYVTVL